TCCSETRCTPGLGIIHGCSSKLGPTDCVGVGSFPLKNGVCRCKTKVSCATGTCAVPQGNIVASATAVQAGVQTLYDRDAEEKVRSTDATFHSAVFGLGGCGVLLVVGKFVVARVRRTAQEVAEPGSEAALSADDAEAACAE
ncbi:unnamed protein product, partial [Polarella glacialis]